MAVSQFATLPGGQTTEASSPASVAVRGVVRAAGREAAVRDPPGSR